MSSALRVLQTQQLESQKSDRPLLSQDFYFDNDRVVRRVIAGRFSAETWLPLTEVPAEARSSAPMKAWTIGLLSGAVPRSTALTTETIRIVDLFCGAGGFSAGLASAGAAAGLRTDFAACVDLDQSGLEVFGFNLKPRLRLRRNVDAMLDFLVRYDGEESRFAYPPDILEPTLADLVGKVDMVVGGPPCQGHSNLNNHTRRTDLRNSLYLTVPAMAVALKAKSVIIENVPSVLRDRSRVVDKARSILQRHYTVQEAVLESDRLGVAQQRKRHFLIATQGPTVELEALREHLHLEQMTVSDAIGDLEQLVGTTAFDTPAELSQQNRDRVDFLFDNNIHNLPNAERPDCHKDGHTYPSVYGRLFSDKPSQTITGGFLSPGRGRYVHPTQRRGLTPHEGARLQGFADSFEFKRADGEKLGNKDYSKLIGDAVPPPMAYAVGLACIATL